MATTYTTYIVGLIDEPTAVVAIVRAVSPTHACRIAAAREYVDLRSLTATERA